MPESAVESEAGCKRWRTDPEGVKIEMRDAEMQELTDIDVTDSLQCGTPHSVPRGVLPHFFCFRFEQFFASSLPIPSTSAVAIMSGVSSWLWPSNARTDLAVPLPDGVAGLNDETG